MSRSCSAKPSCFGDSGCRTGISRAAASRFPGPGCGAPARPLGRSGCVTTATTWCRDASNASSAIAATSGVPKKTTRTVLQRGVPRRRCRCQPELLLAEPSHRLLAQLRRQPVDEEDAVRVIDLVLQDAR